MFSGRCKHISFCESYRVSLQMTKCKTYKFRSEVWSCSTFRLHAWCRATSVSLTVSWVSRGRATRLVWTWTCIVSKLGERVLLLFFLGSMRAKCKCKLQKQEKRKKKTVPEDFHARPDRLKCKNTTAEWILKTITWKIYLRSALSKLFENKSYCAYDLLYE